jgi:hypothetical protein
MGEKTSVSADFSESGLCGGTGCDGHPVIHGLAGKYDRTIGHGAKNDHIDVRRIASMAAAASS